MNTANPGLAGSWWPASNKYPAGSAIQNSYGKCQASNTGEACAYMYGYAKAYDDAYVRGISNSSSLYPLPSWLAGALSAKGAEANCSNAPLTGGGRVTLTQFVSRGFDYDHSCA